MTENLHRIRCNNKTIQALSQYLDAMDADIMIRETTHQLCVMFLHADIPRKNRSPTLLVSCIYIASKMRHRLVSFDKLCEQFHVDKQGVRRMVKRIYDSCPHMHEHFPFFKQQQRVLHDLLQSIMSTERLIHTGFQKDVFDTYQHIMSTNDGILSDYHTNHLAIALIVSCAVKNGIAINKAEFARKYGTSHATLHKYIKLMHGL